ncbi:MAG: DASS family sodium-coupled anion symporter [Candidatus Aminicenantes bacterium]|nr:DASS family sodium-coupled anion symporter [Candidatus Aminicenantes bacterium]
MEPRKKTGFFLGPLLFIFAYFFPVFPQNPKAHTLFAVFLLVVIWWVTECIPIPITALLIPVLITAFKIAPVREAFAPFANPIIMLFLGGFILARAMCVHALDQKLAFSILSRKSIGLKKTRILFALGLISLFLSMWISNTATTAMMFPIALGVLDALNSKKNEANSSSFGIAFLLTMAYASSIGGIGTPIGSPPNLIAIGMLEKLADYRVTFFQWMIIGFSILIPMYFFLFFYMKFRCRIKPKDDSVAALAIPDRKQHSGPLTRAQKNVLVAFSVTVFLWILPGFVSLFWGRSAPLFLWLREHFPESAAAIIGAGLLFLLPINFSRGEFTLSLKEAMNIDWGTLLLFGGGLSLGFQMFETGLADAIGKFFISLGGDSANLALITLLSVALGVFLTEVTSNTASANMIVPIIIAVAKAASISPLPPVLGSAMGCSFAFMLPVATPPNAIVYGSGMIPLQQMIRHGFWLNIAGIILIWLNMHFVAPLLGLL